MPEAKPSPTAQVITFFVLIGLMWFGCNHCNACLDKSVADAEKAEQDLKSSDPAAYRAKMVDEQFSGWDGSHIKLEAMIKASLDDPSSYKHIETTYSDKGSYLLVQTKFRALSQIGLSVLKVVQVHTDPLTGEVIKIVE